MILVLGATGFVGAYLVPRLLDAGHAVRCMARKPADAARLRRLGAEVVLGDVTRAGDDDALLDGARAVVNLVTIIRETPRATFRAVNYEAPLRLLRACERRGVGRFVHVSALGCREDPSLPYLHYKWLLEQEIERSALDFTTLKTSLVFGPGDQSLSFIALVVRSFPWVYVVPGDGRTRYHPIWVEDLVTCIVKAVTGGAASRRTLGIGGGARYTYDELIEVILRASGRSARLVHAPALAFWPAARLMERLMVNPPVTTELLRLLAVDSVADDDAVEGHFGFAPSSFADRAGYLRDVGRADVRGWLRGR